MPSLLCRDFLHREHWSPVLLSTWHTARVTRDPDGTAHTGVMGVRALPCGLDYGQFPLRLFCGDGFSGVLTAYGPLVSGSYFFRLVASRVQVCRVFWEIPSGNVPVLSTIWYDSGYSRQFTVSVWQQRQARTVQTVPGVGLSARSHLLPMRKWPRSSFTTVVWLVWPCAMHLALCWHFSLCSTRCRQAQDFRHHGRYGQEALHQPVEIPQVQFLDKFDVPVVFRDRYVQCCLCTDRGDPTGAVLGQVRRARCVQRQVRSVLSVYRP